MNIKEQSSHRKHGSSCCVGGLAKRQSLTERTMIESGRTIDRPSSQNKGQWSLSSEAIRQSVDISYAFPTNLSSNDSMNSPEEAPNNLFINKAAIAWNEMRREWLGDQPKRSHSAPKEPRISWSTTYEDLLSTSRLFSKPMPLPEMVDFLVDVWHEEGLYG